MASSVCAVVLRLCHLILHIFAAVSICVGLITFPATESTSAKPRAIVWLVFESIYVLVSLNVLVYSVCELINKVPGLYAGIQNRLLNDAKDVSLFYYLMMTLFVLYGTMIGCHIPGLFGAKKSKFLILAVGVSGRNAVLYFLAAFVPLDADFSASNDQVHRVSADTTIDSEDCVCDGCDDTKSCHSTNNPVVVEVNDEDAAGEESKKRSSAKSAEEEARRKSQESKQ